MNVNKLISYVPLFLYFAISGNYQNNGCLLNITFILDWYHGDASIDDISSNAIDLILRYDKVPARQGFF